MAEGVYTSVRELTRLRYRAHGFSYLPMQPVGSVLSGRKRSRLRGRGLDFDELRHYRPGDDIRNMDWRVTSRTRQPYVRVYTEERDRPVWVVVDQRLSMFFGSTLQMKSVVAAEIAALTAWRVIAVGDRIGALLFNDHDLHLVRPSRAPGRVMGWLEQLVRMNRALRADAEWSPRADALATALRRIASHVHHDGLIVIASDFSGWDASCLEAITAIRQHNDVVAALISDPLERDIASARKLVVSDGRFQLEVDPEHQDAARRYREAFTANIRSITDELKRHAIPVVPVDTGSAVASQLQRQLGGQVVAT